MCWLLSSCPAQSGWPSFSDFFATPFLPFLGLAVPPTVKLPYPETVKVLGTGQLVMIPVIMRSLVIVTASCATQPAGFTCLWTSGYLLWNFRAVAFHERLCQNGALRHPTVAITLCISNPCAKTFYGSQCCATKKLWFYEQKRHQRRPKALFVLLFFPGARKSAKKKGLKLLKKGWQGNLWVKSFVYWWKDFIGFDSSRCLCRIPFFALGSFFG